MDSAILPPPALASLPRLPEGTEPDAGDWLVPSGDRVDPYRAGLYRAGSDEAPELVATNGLISRTWRLAPNAATVALDNLMTGESLLRGVKPEASVSLDGDRRSVGGLIGQVEYGYLRREWVEEMTVDPAAFCLCGFDTGPTQAPFSWEGRRGSASKLPWPAPGIRLDLHFSPPPADGDAGPGVSVHYELYDGMPLLCTWLTIRNDSGAPIRLDTFGSGFDAEDDSTANIDRLRSLVEYAHGKDVELGGYSLLASRSISVEVDVVNPATGEPGDAIFGNSPCLGSDWGADYFRKLKNLFERTGLDVLEHDGSYPGDLCASQSHPGHRGLDDSQWTQWKVITEFYQWCRGRGIYLNVPDWYFLSGSNKSGMGYREVNWSLPRDRQLILGRQNIYDGTWEKTPSMGWMFVPLVEYHGGGEAATLEPLCEHLDAYEAHLAQNLGAGVQACYRGPRLYDTEETKAVVKRWVDFYKKHRAILESDVIHVRRADARDLDCILHANSQLHPHRGLAMVYNPLDRAVDRTMTLPLYYTGISDVARIGEQEQPPREYQLAREYTVELPVELPARGRTWFVIESADVKTTS